MKLTYLIKFQENKNVFLFQRRQEELERRAQELERREAELRNAPTNGNHFSNSNIYIIGKIIASSLRRRISSGKQIGSIQNKMTKQNCI